MTIHLTRRSWAVHGQVLVLLVGFAAVLAARVLIGGVDVARSATGGLVFAAGLAALTAAAGASAHVDRRTLTAGAVGGAVLCLPVLVTRALSSGPEHRPGGAFLPWALVVGVVAVAEEAFLRGALYDAVQRGRNETVAVAITTACFALLHVPLYGWGSLPVDVAAGVCLGALRQYSGGWAAPAVAHTLADYAGWWLR